MKTSCNDLIVNLQFFETILTKTKNYFRVKTVENDVFSL